MPFPFREPVFVFGSVLLISGIATAQCPPASTYLGFHQENVGVVLASHGDRAIFGNSNDPGCGMFERRENDWWERIALIHGGGTSGQALGRSCDLVADVAIVGDTLDTSLPGVPGPNGAAVIYELVGGQWIRAIDLYPPTPLTTSAFGSAVALSEDGQRAGVLAGTSGGGEAHVYERLPTGWQLQQIVPLAAPPAALAFVDDLLLVSIGSGTAGEVHTFSLLAGTWTAGAVLAPTTLTPGAAFGACLSRDGTQIAIGAPAHTHTTTSATGAVYVFDTAQANWQNQPRLVRPWTNATFLDFGRAIDIVGDRLAIGARDFAFEFRRVPATGAWSPFFTTWPPFQGFSFAFGRAVAIFSSGILVGDSQYDDDPWNYPNNPGGVHAYDLTDHGNVLIGCGRGIAVQNGGPKNFAINWPQHAGKAYQVFGSFSGLGPTPIAGITLPLSIDGYTTLLLGSGNTYLNNGAGVLNANGYALLEWRVPSGLPHWLAGLQFHHAAVVFDPGPIDASNAITTELIYF